MIWRCVKMCFYSIWVLRIDIPHPPLILQASWGRGQNLKITNKRFKYTYNRFPWVGNFVTEVVMCFGATTPPPDTHTKLCWSIGDRNMKHKCTNIGIKDIKSKFSHVSNVIFEVSWGLNLKCNIRRYFYIWTPTALENEIADTDKTSVSADVLDTNIFVN